MSACILAFEIIVLPLLFEEGQILFNPFDSIETHPSLGVTQFYFYELLLVVSMSYISWRLRGFFFLLTKIYY